MFNPPTRTSDHDTGAKRRVRLALPSVVAFAALAISAPAMATPAPISPSPTVNPAGAQTQGIIMRDGGVCDPIRHMGC